MSPAAIHNWRRDFGIEDRASPSFFASKADITDATSQAHVIRRAFDLLELDGILCVANSPLIYFKQVKTLTAKSTQTLHRKFWNHGGAPILVLLGTEEIQVYSGMSRPVRDPGGPLPSLVKTIDWVSDGLREFVTAVETGEFFRQHSVSFDPNGRIDRDLLNNLRDTRDVLDENSQKQVPAEVLDALLCRLVFTCYLFDREVIGERYLQSIGLKRMAHLKDVLNLTPLRDAKKALYELFAQLESDFNGDLFNDDLDAEAKLITTKHIEILNDFFQGTLVRGRQTSFWAYDFSAIPIETISAIYEHFLKTQDHEKGAFYTPRFLAEIVLDSALEGQGSLLNKTFLDPACGSGIFLVGLFNRIADEWKRDNPNARNDRRARELMQLLRGNLFGVDVNPTACRITAFSLYLAYLDQLAPRDIQELQERGQTLPHLIIARDGEVNAERQGNISCSDFFSAEPHIPKDVDIVVGNPPWGSIAKKGTPANHWCTKNKKILPDFQIAVAFVWKAGEHVKSDGKVCFVLPHGTLFNHNKKAVQFQKSWIQQNTLERVLNLADFRLFLFDKAIHPALVIRYTTQRSEQKQTIEYWAPKVDWSATHAEIISISPSDRSNISNFDLLQDLDGPDAPQLWKQRLWGTQRDLRFLDRLSLYPRLREHIRSSREAKSNKPWVIAEGFQPFGKNDDPKKARDLNLPSRYFIQATSKDIDLFLLEQDCRVLESDIINVRNRSNKNTEVFLGPHVLVTKGFQRIAFADFSVSFQHALRGIHGPEKDRDILIFLAAYLRTSLSKYFMFHTSSSWGMYRPEGHVEEVLRLPFPLPDQMADSRRQLGIVGAVARIVNEEMEQTRRSFIGRSHRIENASAQIETLVEDYFSVQPLEKILINDTLNIIIPSIQPTQGTMPVLTVKHSTTEQRNTYVARLCKMLNSWSKGEQIARGHFTSSNSTGVGLIVLEKIDPKNVTKPVSTADQDVLLALDRLRRASTRRHGVVDPTRGIMFFEKNRLYILKPIGQRYWTESAALNDADAIAGTILMHVREKSE